MKLRRKLVLIFGTSYFLIFMGFFVAIQAFLMQGFLEIEDEDMRHQTELGLHALDLRISELDKTTHEFAASDDTYYYMKSNMKHFIYDLLLSSTFIDAELSFMVFLNNESDVVYSKAFDLMDLQSVPLPETLMDIINQHDGLKNHTSTESKASGILRTSEGSILVSSRPIITSQKSGPIVGTLICGRYIDAIEVAKLKESTFLSLEIIDLTEAENTDLGEALSEASLDEPIFVDRPSYAKITGFSVLKDISGEPVLVFRVDSQRDVYRQGLLVVLYLVASSILSGIIIALLAMVVTDRYVLERIVRLSSEVSEIDPRSMENRNIVIPGDDEVANLSVNIDDMLKALKEYQQRLKERERMATIGETSAMVGHDLRNPLQVIFMLRSRLNHKIGLLRNQGVDKNDLKELEYIEEKLNEQTNYMNKIVSDLQDFSKKINVVYEDTDLEQTVVDVMGTVNVPENIEVSILFEEGLRSIRVDGNLMKRVFTNLVTNAIHAMPDGGSLSITGKTLDGSADIVVSDTGVGVEKENMNKLFQPLFTTKAKGTGLGLAVCKRIVEAHGGRISVESELGVGTSFTIKIPLHAPGLDEDDASDTIGFTEQEAPQLQDQVPEAGPR